MRWTGKVSVIFSFIHSCPSLAIWVAGDGEGNVTVSLIDIRVVREMVSLEGSDDEGQLIPILLLLFCSEKSHTLLPSSLIFVRLFI